MLVKDVIRLAKYKLKNVAASKDNEALILSINLGISDLYNRFNLLIKSETLVCSSDLAVYTLRNEDVNMLLSVYDNNGIELKQSDVIDSMRYDYKLVNYKSFILRKPYTGYLYAVYKASPVLLMDENDRIDLPDAMLEALLAYVSYTVNDTINRDQKGATSYMYQVYDAICKRLDNEGYKIPLNTETTAIAFKGFV